MQIFCFQLSAFCLVWWCFERNTDRIRKQLAQLTVRRA
jgi:hypothetical protein